MSDTAAATSGDGAVAQGSTEALFPLAGFLGLDIDMGGSGEAAAEIEVGPAHLNPHGVVHGAVLFAMLDTAMGAAVMGVLEPGYLCASTDVQIRFLKGVSEGRLAAHVRVTEQDERSVTLAGEVTGEDGRPVAEATGTFAVLEPR